MADSLSWRGHQASILAPPVPTFQPPRDIRRAVQHGKFYTYLLQRTPLALGAVGDRVAQFVVDANPSAFAVYRVAVLADNLGAKVLFVAAPGGQQFSSEPVFLSHLGNGQKPTIIDPPWLLKRKAILQLVVDDRQAVLAANNIRIALFGAKLFADPVVPARRYTAAIQWIFNANFTAVDSGRGALAANEARSYVVTTDADSDFELQAITVVSDAPVTVQVKADGDDLFDADIRSELLGGSLIENPVAPEASGWFPFWLPAPRLIGGGGYLHVRVSNQVAAANRCEVTFHGTRLFPPGGVGNDAGVRRAEQPTAIPADLNAMFRS